jgi:hypothetical protein
MRVSGLDVKKHFIIVLDVWGLAFNITFYLFKNQTEVSKTVDPNDKISYSIYTSI